MERRGPFKIVNNFLEAASENIMFGGGDPAVDGLVPSDIEIRRNLSTKRLSWKSSGVPAKNAFELKNARRVLVDGNMFEHVWTSGQNGTAIVLKSANQDGRCTWCVTEYVTFSNNIVRDAGSGMAINAAETGAKGMPLPRAANHIRVSNVLFREYWRDRVGHRRQAAPHHQRRFERGNHARDVVEQPQRHPRRAEPRRPEPEPRVQAQHRRAQAVRDRRRRKRRDRDHHQELLAVRLQPERAGQYVGARPTQAITDDALKSRYPPVTIVVAGVGRGRLPEGRLSGSVSQPVLSRRRRRPGSGSRHGRARAGAERPRQRPVRQRGGESARRRSLREPSLGDARSERGRGPSSAAAPADFAPVSAAESCVSFFVAPGADVR